MTTKPKITQPAALIHFFDRFWLTSIHKAIKMKASSKTAERVDMASMRTRPMIIARTLKNRLFVPFQVMTAQKHMMKAVIINGSRIWVAPSRTASGKNTRIQPAMVEYFSFNKRLAALSINGKPIAETAAVIMSIK